MLEDRTMAVVVPAYDGLLGILPRHAPMLALLGKGELRVRLKDGAERRFRVSGGFADRSWLPDPTYSWASFAGEVPLLLLISR